MNQHLKEVQSKLLSFDKRTSKQNPESYIGGGQSNLKYIGLRVPDLRNAHKEGFSFSKKSPEQVAEIWDYIWFNSDCFEVMAMALLWFEDPKRRKDLKMYWPLLKKWSIRIDNWAHSDTLSGIYARIHEDLPKEVYTTFKSWGTSKNPWLRRLSIVGVIFYSSQRKVVPELTKVISLIKPQLKFDHYYVQKGVGWTLREVGNIYPKDTYRFMQDNLKDISAQAFSAAVEKMPVKKREFLKNQRKKLRKSI